MFSCVKKNKTKALPSVSVGHNKNVKNKRKSLIIFVQGFMNVPFGLEDIWVGFMRSRNAWDNEPHNFQVIHVHVFT